MSVGRLRRRASRTSAGIFLALATLSALRLTEFAHTTLASEQILGIIPEKEWIGVWTSHGDVTPIGLRAVEVATSVLRKHGIQPENYRSIHVNETEGSFLVQFSDLELHSTINDDRTPPANGRKAIFRIDKQTFEVLGAVY